MNCINISDSLTQYLDGNLGGSSLQVFSEHLKNCPDCLNLVNEVEASYKLLDSKSKIKVSSDFYETTLSSLNKDKNIRVRSIIYNVIKPIAVAASIGLGILIGNGELEVQSSSELQYEEIADLITAPTPATYSVWESIDTENGN